MTNKYKFSIVMAVYNSEKYLSETIQSLINQDIGFEENVQLIIINDGSTDKSEKIAYDFQERYPDNITVISKKNGGQSSARNMGLKYIEGEYVNFLDSDDKLSKESLKNVYEFFKKNNVNIIAIPMYYFDRKQGAHRLNKKFSKNKIVNVFEEYNYPQLSMASCFINSNLLHNFSFNEKSKIAEDALLINKILIKEKRIAFIKNAKYLYRKRNELNSTIDSLAYTKEYYSYKIKYFTLELIDFCLNNLNEVPKFIQYVIAYEIQWYYHDSNILNALTKNEYDLFMDNLHNILNYIDEDIIINHEYLTKDKKSFLIYLKNNEFHIEVSRRLKKVFLKSNDYFINRLHNHSLHIDNIDYSKNTVNICGLFSSNCKHEAITIIAIVKDTDGNKTEYNAEYIEDSKSYRHDYKPLGIPWKYYYNFNLKIPINNKNIKITFKILFKENKSSTTFIPPLKIKEQCILSKKDYFIKDNKIILFKDSAFHLVNKTKKFEMRLKLKSLFQ